MENIFVLSIEDHGLFANENCTVHKLLFSRKTDLHTSTQRFEKTF